MNRVEVPASDGGGGDAHVLHIETPRTSTCDGEVLKKGEKWQEEGISNRGGEANANSATRDGNEVDLVAFVLEDRGDVDNVHDRATKLLQRGETALNLLGQVLLLGDELALGAISPEVKDLDGRLVGEGIEDAARGIDLNIDQLVARGGAEVGVSSPPNRVAAYLRNGMRRVQVEEVRLVLRTLERRMAFQNMPSLGSYSTSYRQPSLPHMNTRPLGAPTILRMDTRSEGSEYFAGNKSQIDREKWERTVENLHLQGGRVLEQGEEDNFQWGRQRKQRNNFINEKIFSRRDEAYADNDMRKLGVGVKIGAGNE